MRVRKMKMIDKYNEAKINNSKSIILIKSGIFYETFNEDAYIMSYLFNYKIKQLSTSIMVGFPEKVIEGIKDRLKKEKISYMIFEDNHQFVSDKNAYTESNYDVLSDISCKCHKVEMEICKIKEKLEVLKSTKSIDEIISRIKEII
jgi:DNA mismatch repair ATPase MutS